MLPHLLPFLHLWQGIYVHVVPLVTNGVILDGAAAKSKSNASLQKWDTRTDALSLNCSSASLQERCLPGVTVCLPGWKRSSCSGSLINLTLKLVSCDRLPTCMVFFADSSWLSPMTAKNVLFKQLDSLLSSERVSGWMNGQMENAFSLPW